MPQFFATCPKGLSKSLLEELKEIGVKRYKAKDSGVEFESSWKKAYEVNLKTRVASRIIKPVLDFEASSLEQIKPGLRKHDFSKYLKKNGSFSLRVKLNNSKFNNQKYLMNEIRVGLLEQFESKDRQDIKVDIEEPDLEVIVQVYKNTFSFGLNMSGAPLSNRGYRQTDHIAPLRENLAAGLVKLSGWSPELPLVDFFCGSGTFLIEAASMESFNEGPFSFKKWANYDKSFEDMMFCGQVKRVMRLYGFDQDPEAVNFSSKLVKDLSLDEAIAIKQLALKDLSEKYLPEDKGIVILNPPYGERLGTLDQAKETYRQIGITLKEHFKGWRAYLISPHPDLSKELKLSAHFKQTINNGGIDCMFLGYEIN